ncbi:replication initiation protein [Chondrinema litorale]|uniref:replication initiation protein n=1 Tax=Chondrinema litorale TaxID=2994555 RepID=UPI0025429F5B|nr:replication initiation protein [Chondrinema litorale]UZR98769.1 replication initiation protein [Chondrinema litorale]
MEDRKNNTLVTKGNDLINARYKLSPTENKLYLLAIAQIEPNDKDFQRYVVPVKKFIKMTGTSSKNVYEQIREVSESLVARRLEIPREGGGFLHIGFVSSAEYKPKKGCVEILIDPKLKPYLLDLKQRFTIYDIRSVLGMRSQFSIRIYELLKSFELIGERVFELMDLRDMLGIETEKYKKYGMFKKRVLDPAKDELKWNFDNPDKKCDLWFKYEELKTGRKVTSIKFYIYNKDRSKQELINDPNHELKEDMKEMGLTEKQVIKYIDKEQKDVALIKAHINDTKEGYKAGKVKNQAAYLITLLERNAQPKSAFQKQPELEKTQQVELNRKQSDSYQKEAAIIIQLKEQFEDFRSVLAQSKINDLSEDEWKAFEEYAEKNKLFTSKFIKNGKINRDKAKTSMLMTAFIGLKLPDYNLQFKEWCFSKYGYQLEEVEGKMRILGKQKTMFG